MQLPESLQVLAHPLVLGIAITLFLVEFVADKIPYVDTAWDAVHTFIRPPAAALLSYSAFAGEGVPEEWKLAAALLAGSVALTSHGAKASTRAAANISPEPVSNWTLSLLEDGLVVFLAWMAAEHPLLTAGIVVVLVIVAVLVIWKLFCFLRSALVQLRGPTLPQPRPDPTPTPIPSRRAAEPSRTAISTAPAGAHVGQEPAGRHVTVGPPQRADVESLHLEHRVGRHHLGREVGDQGAEPVHVHHLADHRLALVVRHGIGEQSRTPTERLTHLCERRPASECRRGGPKRSRP